MAIMGGVWNGSVGVIDGLRGGIGTMGLKDNMGAWWRGWKRQERGPNNHSGTPDLPRAEGRLRPGAAAARPFRALLSS